MRVTSVLGHIKHYEFPEELKDWDSTKFEDLYSAKLNKTLLPNCIPIASSLQNMYNDSQYAILWLD
jgi:hypothetical protein